MNKEMGAPSDHVRKVIRRFDRPEVYIRFLVGCCLLHGAGGLGRVRRVWLQPEFPSKCSIKRIERLDDENQVLSSQILGGEHRLRNDWIDWIAGLAGNYCNSYTVDVPEGCTEHQTNALIRTHLISMERISKFQQRSPSQIAAFTSDSMN
ncbi:abscisic acid receptor PYR/PYL family [Marchantia polymorpha subsp. ruderalis]